MSMFVMFVFIKDVNKTHWKLLPHLGKSIKFTSLNRTPSFRFLNNQAPLVIYLKTINSKHSLIIFRLMIKQNFYKRLTSKEILKLKKSCKNGTYYHNFSIKSKFYPKNKSIMLKISSPKKLKKCKNLITILHWK